MRESNRGALAAVLPCCRLLSFGHDARRGGLTLAPGFVQCFAIARCCVLPLHAACLVRLLFDIARVRLFRDSLRPTAVPHDTRAFTCVRICVTCLVLHSLCAPIRVWLSFDRSFRCTWGVEQSYQAARSAGRLHPGLLNLAASQVGMFSDSDSESGAAPGVDAEPASAADCSGGVAAPIAASPGVSSATPDRDGVHDAASMAMRGMPRTGSWVQRTRRLAASRRGLLGQQLRPLLTTSACSGTNSHIAALKALGVHVIELASAEPKEHAYEFVRQNGLLGRHHYRDVASMISRQEACRLCSGTCFPGERPDVFVAGWPCQPHSTQRSGNMAKVAPRDHPGFAVARAVIAYIRRHRPRTVVLENTPGWSHVHEYDGVAQAGLSWALDQLVEFYAHARVDMNLNIWVAVERPRTYILLVDRDVPDAEQVCTQSAALLEHIKTGRAQESPEKLADYVLRPSDPRWTAEVLQALCSSASCGEKRKASDGAAASRAVAEGGMPKWKEQSDVWRSRWRSQGWHGADMHPLSGARLWQMPAQDRTREILEIILLSACVGTGTCPRDADQLRKLKSELTGNPSQNPVWQPCLRKHVAGLPLHVGTVCRSTRLYSYREDRLITPGEAMRAHGWEADNINLNTQGLDINHGYDLLGESMALPCIGTAIWSLLLVGGNSTFPGMWAEAGYNLLSGCAESPAPGPRQ